MLEGATSKTLKHAEEGTVLLRAGQKYKEGTLAEVDLLACIWQDGVCSDAKLDKKALNIISEADKLVKDREERLEIEFDKISARQRIASGCQAAGQGQDCHSPQVVGG